MKTFIYVGKVIIIDLELEISYMLVENNFYSIVEQQYAWCY